MKKNTNPSSGRQKIYAVEVSAFLGRYQQIQSSKCVSISGQVRTHTRKLIVGARIEHTKLATIVKQKSGPWRVQAEIRDSEVSLVTRHKDGKMLRHQLSLKHLREHDTKDRAHRPCR